MTGEKNRQMNGYMRTLADSRAIAKLHTQNLAAFEYYNKSVNRHGCCSAHRPFRGRYGHHHNAANSWELIHSVRSETPTYILQPCLCVSCEQQCKDAGHTDDQWSIPCLFSYLRRYVCLDTLDPTSPIIYQSSSMVMQSAVSSLMHVKSDSTAVPRPPSLVSFYCTEC